MKWRQFGPGDYVSWRYRFKINRTADGSWQLIDMQRNWKTYTFSSLNDCKSTAEKIQIFEQTKI